MLIPCPVCGRRDSGEFAPAGDATVARPAFDNDDEKAWASAVYDRANPRGAHEEYWHHRHGCRHWLIVSRDTQTHAVKGARLAGVWVDHAASVGARAGDD